MSDLLPHWTAPIRRLGSIGGRLPPVALLLILVTAAFFASGAWLGSGAQAQTSRVTIVVRDAYTGELITDFRYIINLDDSVASPSATPPSSYSPVVATGDSSNPTVTLASDKYLVSVLAGPFDDPLVEFSSPYGLGGAYFRLPDNAGNVVVELVPGPVPLSTLRVRVFHDNQNLDSEENIPMERGLAGFNIVVHDEVGEVTVDGFGNSLCTRYSDVPGGTPVPGTGGTCLSDGNGDAIIPNLPRGKYEVEVIPPDGSGWIQTGSIEGSFGNDAWLWEGADGFSTETDQAAGQPYASVWFGFVKECRFGDGNDSCPTNDVAGSTTIFGRVRNFLDPFDLPGVLPGVAELREVVPNPYIALTNLSGNDEQVFTGRGNPDGTFSIRNVPTGIYQLVIWDLPIDHIISFGTIIVGPLVPEDLTLFGLLPFGQSLPPGVKPIKPPEVEAPKFGPFTCIDGYVCALGDIGIPGWFGSIKGTVYEDSGVAVDGTVFPDGANNGIRDCHSGDPRLACEPGIAGQDLDLRFKDGTVYQATFSDSTGFYEFPEIFELERFRIWEVGYGRFAQVGTAAYPTDEHGNPIGYPYQPIYRSELGTASLLAATLNWAQFSTWIDTGKRAWRGDENGGIAGIVFYATTRNEFDARLAAAEDYEPGIPGVTLNLYSAALDSAGRPIIEPDGSFKRGALVNTVETDSWNDNLPTNCDVPRSFGRDPSTITPFNLGPDCVELGPLFNQVKDGVFDGGYAIDADCQNLSASDPFDPEQLLPEDDCVPLPAGKYIVEVVPPPGYEIVKEEDQNTDAGDTFVPQVAPVPCAGALHLVNDPRNPFDGQERPLCDSKLVTLLNGANPEANFFLFTDVPVPGRVIGLVPDDLSVEINPTNALFADKRGIPNVPVGIYDWTGRLITTVHTDDNGYFDVLLPSTYTALCPTPSGICSAMYIFVANDAGDPLNPNQGWDPNYTKLALGFQVWPGTTVPADIAIIPSTAFVGGFESTFDSPPVCNVAVGMPDFQSVSVPYGQPGQSFTIDGSGFGSNGQVTLDGMRLAVNSWSDTSIQVVVPNFPGPRQLEVTNISGETAPTGLTFHVLAGDYDPPIVTVAGPSSPGDEPIQAAIDAAAPGSLIVVNPGIYIEKPILHKDLKLQGHGPGVTVLDGRFSPPMGVPDDITFEGVSHAAFEAKVAGIAFDGPPVVPFGQTITVLAEEGEFQPKYNTQIDGFAIVNARPARGQGLSPALGGGVYAHAFSTHLEISNNVIQSNQGTRGGGIILGQPYEGGLRNEFVHIHHNRILNNGGQVLAGGVAIYNGAQDYEIDHNVICGNYSAEYGGGISHFGFSSGQIHDNDILFNYAFDEGGGIMIAGELVEEGLSPGTGAVTIERNLIQGNVTNDDGGGIRLLQPVDGVIKIINNLIANNVATDHGGGISIDDALRVWIVNNTIAKNISTSTAQDAPSQRDLSGLATLPQGAGLATETHSAALISARGLRCLLANCFSNPIMLNNIFWDNRAWHLDGANGLVEAGVFDMQVSGTTDNLSASYSVCTGFTIHCPDDGTNIVANPQFVQEITTEIVAVPFGGDPRFITILIKRSAGDPLGDYHLLATSPAINAGVSAHSVPAPNDDFEGQPRSHHDLGADEFWPQEGPHENNFSEFW